MSDWTRTEASDELGANAWVLDEMRDLWAADPTSVDDSWRALFEGEPPGTQSATTASPGCAGRVPGPPSTRPPPT